MKKESAVDWLVNQVDDFVGKIPANMIIKAKKMEEDNLTSQHLKGFILGLFSATVALLISKFI
jgi:hypothetical protein